MPADRLIAYLLVGPRTLDPNLADVALTLLLEHRRIALERKVPEALGDEMHRIEQQAAQLGTDPWELIEDALFAKGHDQLYTLACERGTEEEDLRAQILDFARWWNEALDSDGHTVCRNDPHDTDRRIVFAGEFNSGDPASTAYAMIDWANHMGLLAFFGIR